MIDRAARDQAVTLVQNFWAGKISNRDLEDLWPNSVDEGVVAVSQFMWTLYDDFKIHLVREEDVGDVRITTLIANCIVFFAIQRRLYVASRASALQRRAVSAMGGVSFVWVAGAVE